MADMIVANSPTASLRLWIAIALGVLLYGLNVFHTWSQCACDMEDLPIVELPQ
jgi:hypothetical protein